MNTRPRAIAIGCIALLAACSENITPTPEVSGIRRFDGTASVISHDFPTIQYPSGIANDGFSTLYVSTLTGARDTYVIDAAFSAITRTIAYGGNPRDVVYVQGIGDGLAYADLGFTVEVRGAFWPSATIPLPWRGGGIARWRDSIFVGNADSDSILVASYSVLFGAGPIVRKFPTPTRNEGLVADTTMAVPSTTTLWSISPFDSWMTEIDVLGNFIRRCNTPYTPGPTGLGGITLMRDTFFLAYPIGGDPLAGTRITRIARSDLVCGGADSIDIKPGHFPNRVNPGSNQKIDVAVFTTPGRDATALITATVRFGRTGTEAPAISRVVRDVDGDGDLDVVFEFRTNLTGILCGDTEARLRGSATSGPPIDASDSILTIGCGRP